MCRPSLFVAPVTTKILASENIESREYRGAFLFTHIHAPARRLVSCDGRQTRASVAFYNVDLL